MPHMSMVGVRPNGWHMQKNHLFTGVNVSLIDSMLFVKQLYPLKRILIQKHLIFATLKYSLEFGARIMNMIGYNDEKGKA